MITCEKCAYSYYDRNELAKLRELHSKGLAPLKCKLKSCKPKRRIWGIMVEY